MRQRTMPFDMKMQKRKVSQTKLWGKEYQRTCSEPVAEFTALCTLHIRGDEALYQYNFPSLRYDSLYVMIQASVLMGVEIGLATKKKSYKLISR